MAAEAAQACHCCGDPIIGEIYKDQQLGEICPDCKFRIFKAVVVMRKFGIMRPLNKSDLNENNQHDVE